MIVAAALFLGLAFQTISPEAASHAQAGLSAAKAGQFDQAIAEFKKVTELEPGFAGGFINLGAAYIQNHDYADAVAPLQKAVHMDESVSAAQQMLGYALLMEGDAQGAIPHLERANAQEFLGIAQLETGKLADAVANLNAALAKRPNDPELLYYLSRASGLLSKDAMDTLESAFPDSARAHQSLGESYAALRHVPEAEKECLEALKLRPDLPGAHLELGQLYAAAAEWPKAEEQFQLEAKLQPANAEAAYRLGQALLEEGKLPQALRELKRADQLRPEMPETLYALGKAESLSGDNAGAEHAWTHVAALEKTGGLAAQAEFSLAALYRKEGRTADAEREMEKYKALQGSPK